MALESPPLKPSSQHEAADAETEIMLLLDFQIRA